MSAEPVHRVEIEGAGVAIAVSADESILEGALRAGVDLPHDCALGGCGTCRIRLLAGTVAYPDPDELPFGLAPEEAAAGYALACQARPTSDLRIEAPEIEALQPAERRRAVVESVRPLGSSILHWTVGLEGGEAAGFLPGQYMNVLLDDGSRSFSMASAPGTAVLDFYVRRIAGGRFTDIGLGDLRPGDALDVELPHGTFLYRRRDDCPLIMAATGTGIAPIKSIVESLLDDPDTPPLALYWGMRSEDELFLGDEIAAWAGRLPDFRYIPVLSRPDAGWGGRHGYVQDAVLADHPDLSEHAIYLCGSPAMIVGAKQGFIARGASPERLYAEGFTANGVG